MISMGFLDMLTNFPYASEASQPRSEPKAKALRCQAPFMVIRTEKGTQAYPKDPSVLKMVRRAKFTTARKNATAIAKTLRIVLRSARFLGKRGRKTVRIVKHYGGSKILRIRAPYYF